MNPAWTPATLSSLAYCLFAVQQPGPVSDLRTQDEAHAEGLLTPVGAAVAGPEPDAFLRRQNVLGEISLLDL